MNINDAKRLAVLEALANALGLPLWQYEASQAVDDGLLDQLRADLRRGDPSIARSPIAKAPQTAEEILSEIEDWHRQEQRRKEAEARAEDARHPAPWAREGARRGGV